MCTVVIMRRPEQAWPLIFAANRDEMNGRPWRAPARHWPDRPSIIGGLDEQAGGTWLALNDSGLVAAVLNRPASLGPEAGKKSRGELPLVALDAKDLDDAVARIAEIDARAYRSFNMVIAGRGGAYWLKANDEGADRRPSVHEVPEGLHMITAHDLDDPESPRIRRHLPLFRAAEMPEPAAGRWGAWIERLADRSTEEPGIESGAMTIGGSTGFGTVSSSLIALASADERPIWMFAAGQPDKVSFTPIETHTMDCV
jgi:Transport and Golgi organisation 2